jgi:hypothetical protein
MLSRDKQSISEIDRDMEFGADDLDIDQADAPQLEPEESIYSH